MEPGSYCLLKSKKWEEYALCYYKGDGRLEYFGDGQSYDVLKEYDIIAYWENLVDFVEMVNGIKKMGY